jgi:hypothetical protein
VSVTLSVDAEGAVQWWLTKESGQPPDCSDRARCNCAAERGSFFPERRSYIVLCVWDGRPKGSEAVSRRPMTIIGCLSSQRLRMVFLRMAGEIQGIAGERDCTMRLRVRLLRGWFRNEGCEGCALRRDRCASCTEGAEGPCGRLIICDYYEALDGSQPAWFGGVTDAAAHYTCADGSKGEWLQCVSLSKAGCVEGVRQRVMTVLSVVRQLG